MSGDYRSPITTKGRSSAVGRGYGCPGAPLGELFGLASCITRLPISVARVGDCQDTKKAVGLGCGEQAYVPKEVVLGTSVKNIIQS